MNIYSEIKDIIINSLEKKYNNLDESIFKKISCEKPKDPKHGDVSTNAALIILKHTKININDIANLLITDLKKNSIFTEIEFQNPGFINFKININYWYKLLDFINKNSNKYGFKNFGQGKKINLEFVSANPTGPLHVGHVRGAIYGDVLANLLKKNGFLVTKEYYVNDLGNQIDILANTIKLHVKNFKYNTNQSLDNEMYKGVYLKELSIEMYKKYPKIFDNDVDLEIKKKAVECNLNLIVNDLHKLDIKFDKFVSEKKLHENGIVNKAIGILKKKELLYKGKLDKPKGKKEKDWESKEQILFRSKEFGDDSDRAIMKKDGTWTYFSSDIAYHYDKALRGYDEIINIWGADHAGYIKRVSSALKALNFNNLQFTVKLCQIVNIIDNKKVIKMSKRAGNFILLSEVIDGIGKDALRFFMLIRKNDAHLDFDLEKCLTDTKENPVFYVQYAHARINSIKRIIIEKGLLIKEYSSDLLFYIKTEMEVDIIKTISIWPKVIESSVTYKEPHRIVFYLLDLSSMLHSFWNMGKSDNKYRIICENNMEMTSARLVLLEAVQSVLKNGLDILSIKPAQKM